MKQTIAAAAVVIMSASAGFANEATRLTAAANAVREIRAEIPEEYWTRARCVLVIPELKKAAFILGGEFGKGVMSCRAGEQWSAPVFMQLAKGGWGFQVGVEQAGARLLLMTAPRARKLLTDE